MQWKIFCATTMACMIGTAAHSVPLPHPAPPMPGYVFKGSDYGTLALGTNHRSHDGSDLIQFRVGLQYNVFKNYGRDPSIWSMDIDRSQFFIETHLLDPSITLLGTTSSFDGGDALLEIDLSHGACTTEAGGCTIPWSHSFTYSIEFYYPCCGFHFDTYGASFYGALTVLVLDRPVPVPLPAAAWLLSGALAALGLAGRRRRGMAGPAARSMHT